MADTPETDVSSLGIFAVHPKRADVRLGLAPTIAKEFNTVRQPLQTIACALLPAHHFEFDSSFIGPSVAGGLARLAKLMAVNEKSPISVFGHADPVGDDDYNKKLSGRRARAVFALLIHDTDIWEDLFKNPLGHDNWGNRAIQTMLLTVGNDPGRTDGVMDDPAKNALKAFQKSKGLKESGDADKDTRAKLFAAYMDTLYGKDFKALDKSKDFLGEGADAEGKAAMQGCSEFNPLLMFSKSENDAFAAQSDKTERNKENAANRRVLVYLFKPGTKIDVKKWPCPTVKEGVAGCNKRLFADQATRRKFQAERRLHETTRDTFACRFYDRIAGDSPCEKEHPGPGPVIPPAGFAVAALITFLAADGKPSTKPKNGITLVKKPYTAPARTPVELKTDQDFDGTGTLERSSPNIDVFLAKTGGSALTFDGKDNVFTGAQLSKALTVFAEGNKVSGGVDDVKLKLTLTPGTKTTKPPVEVTITAIELTLDIGRGREKAGTDPTPLEQATTATAPAGKPADKVFGGRRIHVQDSGKRNRAMLFVRPVQPSGVDVKLVLSPKDAKVECFDVETGGAALAANHEFDSSTVTGTGLKFFVQGKNPSAALNDTSVRLGVKDQEPEADRVGVTVYKVTKIDAKLPSTPCLRDKTLADANAVKSSTDDKNTFDATAITVVRKCGTMKLTVTHQPSSAPLSFDFQRATDDDKALTDVPSVKATGNATADLVCDGAGSFHISAFIDDAADGDGKRGLEEDGLRLNVNMVKIAFQPGAASNQIITRNNLFNDTSSNANFLTVHSGSTKGTAPGVNAKYTDATFLQHPLAMKATLKMTGGGADQKRGLDKVGLGYIQVTTGDSFKGTYADGRTVKEVITVAAGNGNITSGNPPLLGFPVRDTRNAVSTGTGPYIISSSDNDKTDTAGGGQEWIVRYVDPPAIGIQRRHPDTSSALVSISGSNDFQSFLSAFSKDFDSTYTVVAHGSWKATYGTFSAATGWSIAGAGIATTAQMTAPADPVPASTLPVDRCPPNFVDNLKMDAR